MLAILFLCGVAAIVAGVALWSVPAALVVGGSALCGMSIVLARGQRRAATPDPPEGGDA